MNCNNCNKENHPDSKFCRFCGSKLNSTKVSFSIKLPDFSGLIAVIRKQNKKAIIIAALVIIVGAGTAFAAPKINDYIKVNGLVSEALKLESAGDYQAALASLVLTKDKWTLESKRQEVEKLKESQTKYAQFKEAFESASEKEGAGKLAEARELLQSIDTNYPEYEKVKEKLNNIQEAIEGNLKEQARLKELEAQRQAAAAAEARRQAQAERAAKVRAEAEKAASEAQARAAAESARQAEIQRQQAEVRRQQEEQQKLEERRISFLNQLSSIYSATNRDGISYYNNAMSYYNSGSELAALAGFGQAQAIFVNAYNNALSLKNSFSGGLPSTYLAAVNNMMYATDYYDKAVDSINNHIASGAYGTSNANYYSNNGDTYMSNVRSFLTSQGY